MADDNQVNVKIVGDASGVAPAVEATKDQIGGLTAAVQQMSAQFAELAAAITGSMQTGAATTAEMAGEMKTLIAETEKESLSLRELAVSAREGLTSFAEMRESLMGIGELLMAAFAVEEIAHFAESIGDAAEKTLHLSQQLGLSIGQTQSLAAAAAATGVPFDALTRGLGQIDLHLAKNPKLFADLGIQIPKNADQMTVLNAVMDHFNGMADGPNKTAEALALMGRAGKELIPFLNEGADGLAALVEKAREYGAVNTDAAAKGVVLAESLNEGKLAMDGLKLTLSDAFAPLLTEVVDGFNNLVKSMTESYNTGGAVKVAFEAIVEVFQGLGEIISTIGSAFSVMFSGTGSSAIDWAAVIKAVIDAVVITFKVLEVICVTLVEAVKIVFDTMVGQAIDWYGRMYTSFEQIGEAIEIMKVEFTTLGTVVNDALTLQWGSIASDWDAGMAQIDSVVKTRGKQIADDAKSYAQQAMGWFGSSDAEANKLAQYWAHAGDTQAPKPTGISLPKTGNDSGGDLSSAGKKDKKPKDDVVQRLDEELKAKQVAWAMEQDAQGTAQEYSLQSIAEYWKDALSRADLSEKDRLAISEKYLNAHQKVTDEEFKAVLDGYKGKLEAAKSNAASVLTITEQEAAEIGKHYGLESNQYKEAMNQVVVARRNAEQQIRQLAEETETELAKLQTGEVDRQQADANFLVQMGAKTQAQLLTQERSFENARFQIQDQALQQRKALIDPNLNPVEYAKVTNQIADLERAHQAKITQIDQQAILQRTLIERTAINSTASLWGQNIAKLITLQQGFATTLHGLYVGMVGIISDALASIIQKWLVQHLSALLIGGAASKANGVAEISTQAAIAGAGGVASMAAAPFPLDLGAPAFGAAMAASAMGFASLLTVPSLSGGSLRTSEGLTMIHEDEAVIPAWGADGLRNMIGAFSGLSMPAGASSPFASMLGTTANNNQPAAANDGGNSFHYHDHTERGVSADDIIANHAAVGKAVKIAHRKGMFAGTGIAV